MSAIRSSSSTSRDLVYRIVSHIPRGRVLTYGGVARLAGLKNPRLVGHFLHVNENWRRVPCHRVVNAAGRVAPAFGWGGARIHASRLRRDGVTFLRHDEPAVVDLKRHLWKPTPLFRHFIALLKRFGDPGPWPWYGQDKPHTPEEIAIGAILTQNTNWKNVEKALANLRRDKACGLHPIACLAKADKHRLLALLRPSGFFRQKAARLTVFARAILRYGRPLAHHAPGRGDAPRRPDRQTLTAFLNRPTNEVRRDLLVMHGIGPETADTILLYAGDHPIFVIDAYTRRYVHALKLTRLDSYDELQRFFTDRLPTDARLFQDFHALIVQWAKTTSRHS